MFQTKEPRLESASRDDRSSKHQPKRVERGRERSLGERRHAFAAQVTKTVWTRFLEREAAELPRQAAALAAAHGGGRQVAGRDYEHSEFCQVVLDMHLHACMCTYMYTCTYMSFHLNMILL